MSSVHFTLSTISPLTPGVPFTQHLAQQQLFQVVGFTLGRIAKLGMICR